MIGYAEKEVFTGFEKTALRRATALVAKVPYELNGEPIRCHELARAVGFVLGLSVCDGRFGFVEHSWIWLSEPDPIDGELHPWCLPRILDTYVPGSLPQVQIVDVASGLPARYLPALPRTDVREDVVRQIVDLFDVKTLCAACAGQAMAASWASSDLREELRGRVMHYFPNARTGACAICAATGGLVAGACLKEFA